MIPPFPLSSLEAKRVAYKQVEAAAWADTVEPEGTLWLQNVTACNRTLPSGNTVSQVALAPHPNRKSKVPPMTVSTMPPPSAPPKRKPLKPVDHKEEVHGVVIQGRMRGTKGGMLLIRAL